MYKRTEEHKLHTCSHIVCYGMKTVDKIDTALKPLLYLCKVFGLSPFSYINEEQTGGTKLMSLPSDVLWCVAVFVCYVTNFVLSMYVMRFDVWDYPAG